MRVTSLEKRNRPLSVGYCARFAALYATSFKRLVSGGVCLAGRVYTNGSRHHEHTITSR